MSQQKSRSSGSLAYIDRVVAASERCQNTRAPVTP